MKHFCRESGSRSRLSPLVTQLRAQSTETLDTSTNHRDLVSHIDGVNMGEGEEKEEFSIKPENVTTPISTEDWPLLLKNYDKCTGPTND